MIPEILKKLDEMIAQEANHSALNAGEFSIGFIAGLNRAKEIIRERHYGELLKADQRERMQNGI